MSDDPYRPPSDVSRKTRQPRLKKPTASQLVGNGLLFGVSTGVALSLLWARGPGGLILIFSIFAMSGLAGVMGSFLNAPEA